MEIKENREYLRESGLLHRIYCATPRTEFHSGIYKVIMFWTVFRTYNNFDEKKEHHEGCSFNLYYIILNKLNEAHFCCIAATGACFDNTAVTTVSVCIFRSYFIKKLFNNIFLSYISKNLSS